MRQVSTHACRCRCGGRRRCCCCCRWRNLSCRLRIWAQHLPKALAANLLQSLVECVSQQRKQIVLIFAQRRLVLASADERAGLPGRGQWHRRHLRGARSGSWTGCTGWCAAGKCRTAVEHTAAAPMPTSLDTWRKVQP